MAWLKLNNFACQDGTVHLPLTGAWTAKLAIDPASSTDDLPAEGDQVTLNVNDGVTLAGTVRRVNNAFETILALVIGGGGGLPTVVPPKAYQQVTIQQVVQDLLGQVGEQLSSSSDPQVLGTNLAFWSVLGGQASAALAELVDEASANWRVLPDGTIWIGLDNWPATDMDDWDLYQWKPQDKSAVIYADSPSLLPGQTWSGGNVADVVHELSDEVRTSVYFEDAFA